MEKDPLEPIFNNMGLGLEQLSFAMCDLVNERPAKLVLNGLHKAYDTIAKAHYEAMCVNQFNLLNEEQT